jgi:holo-[acyl-carrier protein] synthase
LIVGVGTDLLLIERIRAYYKDCKPYLLQKVFSSRELAESERRPDAILYYATRFAGKEAVFKCFGINDGSKIRLNEIEILNSETGQPRVTLHGQTAEVAKAIGIQRICISLSYDTDYATAYAIAEGKTKKP